MKVFFTLETLANAGTEKSTLDIVQHFSKDTEVKVIYFYKGHDLKEAYEREKPEMLPFAIGYRSHRLPGNLAILVKKAA